MPIQNKKLDSLRDKQREGVRLYKEMKIARFKKGWGFVDEKEFYRIICTLNRREKLLHKLEASIGVPTSESWRNAK